MRNGFGSGARGQHRLQRGQAGDNETGAGADTELDAEEGETIEAAAGKSSELAAQDGSRGSGGPLRYLIWTVRSIQSAFARRSRRKESDKTAVIQQHLRAIRHAENLDRQTHFRRSQGELIDLELFPRHS